MKRSDEKQMLLGSSFVLDPVKTFECGQCFRWNADDSGVYTGIVGNSVYKVFSEDGNTYISGDIADADELYAYFDLASDYSPAEDFSRYSSFLAGCIEYGRGIRLLRQDPWEASCSFVISQCNNIPRIKKIVETLCSNFGEEIGGAYYSFPGAEKIASLSEKDLEVLRSGYRAEYILNTARAVCDGTLDFEELKSIPYKDAKKKLLSVRGIGEKVANCILLFGLGHIEAFPVDTWMKKALKAYFPENFDPAVFGDYAGLIQQYIFYYSRSGGIEEI